MYPVRAAAAAIALACTFVAANAAEETKTVGTLPTQLGVTEQVAGTGREIQRGAFAVMHYRGWLFDPAAADGKGKLFIDSREKGKTLTYVYGYERAIKGLERGLEGMKVGAHRTIVIPPKLAYDNLKHPYPPDVPVGSALIFEVDLIDVVPQGAPPDQ